MKIKLLLIGLLLAAEVVNADSVCIEEEGSSSKSFGGALPFINDFDLWEVFSSSTDKEVKENKDIAGGVVVGDEIVTQWIWSDGRNRNRYSIYEATQYRNGSSKFEGEVCVDNSDVLEVGNNNAKVEFWLPYGGKNTSYRAELVNSLGRDITICDYYNLKYDSNDSENNSPECESKFYISLEDFAPDLYRQLVEAEKELLELVVEALDQENEYEEQVIHVTDAITRIDLKSFDEIFDSDLEAVSSVLTLYKDLKKDLADLRNETQFLSNQLSDMWQEATLSIDTTLHEYGYDVSQMPALPQIDISSLSMISGTTPVQVDNINYYRQYAEQTKDQLQSLAISGNNREFVLAAKQWLINSNALQEQLSSQLISTPQEWEALTQAFEDVESYVFTVVDQDFWFLDSPVTQQQREALKSINNYSQQYGEMIEHNLRSWRSDDMTQDKQDLLTTLEAAGNGIEASMENGQNEDFDDLLFGLATSIREGSICAAKVMITGDFGDFYEVVIGKDLCSGEQLTTGERLFSSLGFVAGNGHFWRGVGKTLGLLVRSRNIVNLTAFMKDQARIMNMSDGELKRFVERLSDIPC